jgi:hypothetical protein
MDNLNTHRVASLYETYPAAEAKSLRDKKRIGSIEQIKD